MTWVVLCYEVRFYQLWPSNVCGSLSLVFVFAIVLLEGPLCFLHVHHLVASGAKAQCSLKMTGVYDVSHWQCLTVQVSVQRYPRAWAQMWHREVRHSFVLESGSEYRQKIFCSVQHLSEVILVYLYLNVKILEMLRLEFFPYTLSCEINYYRVSQSRLRVFRAVRVSFRIHL